MSYTTLWEVYKTTATPLSEYRNSHGSAPPIWDYLAYKYLGWKGYFYDKDLKPLWDLKNNVNVPTCFRCALIFTFDYALIKKECAKKYADYFDEVYFKLLRSEHWGVDKVNHWQLIANDLRNRKFNKKSLGIGLGATSVCDPWEEWPTDEKVFFVDDLLIVEEDNKTKSPLTRAG